MQAVVERVTSANFASVMHELVLSPLGMSSSSFDWSDVQADVHRPHRRAGQPMAPQFSAWAAAGGLYSTAPDLGRFVDALIAAGNSDGQLGPISRGRLEQVASSTPAAAGAFGLRRGGYGLGHAWTRGRKGRLTIANHGSNPGWRAMFAAIPERRAGLSVVANSDTGTLLTLEALMSWLAETGALSRRRNAPSRPQEPPQVPSPQSAWRLQDARSSRGQPRHGGQPPLPFSPASPSCPIPASSTDAGWARYRSDGWCIRVSHCAGRRGRRRRDCVGCRRHARAAGDIFATLDVSRTMADAVVMFAGRQ